LYHPFNEPPPEDAGITGVYAECEGDYHFKTVKFDTATVFVTMKAAHSALVEYAGLQHSRDITRHFCYKAPKQVGDLVLGHPNLA
jgi:hypothetical protein